MDNQISCKTILLSTCFLGTEIRGFLHHLFTAEYHGHVSQSANRIDIMIGLLCNVDLDVARMLLGLAVHQMKGLDPTFYVSQRRHFAQPLV